MVLSTRVVGAGRPIVLLPWFSLDSAVMARAFEPVFAAGLGVDSGWRRIYLDLPWTGGSSPVAPASYAVLDAVQETVESMVGAEPYLLAGCSYGGYLAGGLVRRVPAQVSALLLVCSGVKSVLSTQHRRRWRVDAATWLARSGAVELHGHFDHAVGLQTKAVARRMAGAFAPNGPTDDGYLTALRSTGYPLGRGLSHSLRREQTMLAGRQDRIAGYRDQLEALDRYPRGDYVLMNDAGHYLPLEQLERFMTCTLDWLERSATDL